MDDPVAVAGLIICIAAGLFMVSPKGAKLQARWNEDLQNPLAPGTRPTTPRGVRILGTILLVCAIAGGVLLLALG